MYTRSSLMRYEHAITALALCSSLHLISCSHVEAGPKVVVAASISNHYSKLQNFVMLTLPYLTNYENHTLTKHLDVLSLPKSIALCLTLYDGESHSSKALSSRIE